MASFAELNIFNQIIKLPELKVKDYQFIEGLGVVLTVENIKKKLVVLVGEKKAIAYTKTMSI
ncbi:MAG: hypothetical protein Kow0049_03160 [Stanieria sp.]